MFNTFKRRILVLSTFTLLLVSTVFCTASLAEPVKPELVMTGETTEDAEFHFKWPDTSVVITGKEIARTLGLEEGNFQYKKYIRSEASGLPVIDWYCNCEGLEPHRLHAAVELRGTELIASVRDSLTGKTLQKTAQTTFQMAPTINVPYTKFRLRKQELLFDAGSLDLEKVLRGGKWKKTDVVFDGYQGALEWQCDRPSSAVKPRLPSCYCPGGDKAIDTPDCWSFHRVARVAFRKIDDNAI